jgi:pimeloyl-ACP methyl ester carboxylesterase
MTQQTFSALRRTALIRCAAILSATGLILSALQAQTNPAGATPSHESNSGEEFMNSSNIANEAPPEAPAATVTNIVLVHGAWADGSSWSKIIPLLQAKGFHVVAVHSPLTTIAEDVAATNRIINQQEGPVLLAGHSYGGAVITEAGNNPKVAGLMYVAAFAPDEGETLGGLAKGFPTPPAFGELHPIEDGFLLLTSKGVMEDFAQDLSPAEKKLMLATQSATQGALLGTPIKAAAWHTKPSWFVIASNDRTIAPEQEISTAKRMGAKTLTLASSHVPMLSQPEKVANFMMEAAASLAVSASSASAR